MLCQELLTESEILKDEILSRTESTHGPSQEMTKRGDDDQNHGESYRNTRRQVSLQFIHSAVARGFDEGQPLTPLAREAFRGQLRLSPCRPYLFPSDENPSEHQRTLKTTWHATLRRAKVPYFRIYDRRSTYATRLSAGGVADEWVT
jgi:integrase